MWTLFFFLWCIVLVVLLALWAVRTLFPDDDKEARGWLYAAAIVALIIAGHGYMAFR
jgi:hypothetical protein